MGNRCEELIKAVMFNPAKDADRLEPKGEWPGGEASALLSRGCRATGREALPNPPFSFHLETK